MTTTLQKNSRTFLITSSILLGLSLFPALGMAMFSPMLFDSPGSEENTLTVAIAISIISYPFITFALLILTWIFYTKQKYKVSLILCSIPYLHIIIIILLFVFLGIFCDGNFSC